MKQPMIECQRCEGTGKVPLSPELFQTLEAVKRLGSVTAPELWLSSDRKTGVTAFNQRLNDLCRLGFIERVRVGKNVEYTMKGKG